MKHQSRQENTLYAVLWIALFTAPAIILYIQSVRHQQTFRFDELLYLWKQFAVYLAIFLVHNFLLAPMLLHRGRRALYFSVVAVLIAVFAAVQCASRPPLDEGPQPELSAHRPPFHTDDGTHHPPFDADHTPPPPPEGKPQRDGLGPAGPMVVVGQHDVVAVIVLILMLGMNIGVKLYFRQKGDQQRMAELERENLEQQLEYLKYQINPHFLMNTLNNIHALVDIEPEQAKESIVELSKIMRFVLYDGARPRVPLQREIAFMENYLQLMRIRLSEQVRLNVELPEHIPDCDVPPLLFITFVENAFKHGVSYQQPSFIDITLDAGATHLHFSCRNSKVAQAEDRHGGVGLQNARRRLELIYADRFTLDIDDTDSQYAVDLTLPIENI